VMSEASDTLTAVLRLKTGFALTHLQVAAQSARLACTIEQENVGQPFGPWFDGMMRTVPVAIVMAGAALEANANELLQDILDGQTRLDLTNSRRKLLLDLKEDYSGNAVVKYRRLALLMDKDCDTGTEPWHNAKLLVRYRNEFMHFRPSWDDEDIHSGVFVEELKRKMPVVAAYERAFMFPYGLMTYGCAKWAVQTVLEFCSDFAKLLDVRDRFTTPGGDFNLP
jgi:hypothetical protein